MALTMQHTPERTPVGQPSAVCREVPRRAAPAVREPKLMDRLREALRSCRYSRRTGQTFSPWVKRFIFFHHVRHPAEMAEPEINGFLTLFDKVSNRLIWQPQRYGGFYMDLYKQC